MPEIAMAIDEGQAACGDSSLVPAGESGGCPNPGSDGGPKAGKSVQLAYGPSAEPARRARSVSKRDASRFESGYALIVGVANYLQMAKLPHAVLHDAARFATVLWDPEKCCYPVNNVKLLCDKQATRAAIVEGLAWLAESAGPDDTALFFFSGHGARLSGEDGASSLLLAWDADPRGGGSITGMELAAMFRRLRASRVGIFLDSCFASGAASFKHDAGQGRLKYGFDEDLYQKLLATGRGRAIIASSTESEESLVLDGMHNSLFSHYLFEALDGKAAKPNKVTIGILDVFEYVARGVPSHDSRQHPVLKADAMEDNFPIAMAPLSERRRLLAAQDAPHGREQRKASDNRRKAERRRIDDRREALREQDPSKRRFALKKRFRNGIQYAMVKEFGVLQNAPFLWEGRRFLRVLAVLQVELEKYILSKNGAVCHARDVLYEVVGRFHESFNGPAQLHDNSMFYFVEAVSEAILNEFDVVMRERRTHERRFGDRRGAQAAVEGIPAGAK
jgi:hypothetical protein